MHSHAQSDQPVAKLCLQGEIEEEEVERIEEEPQGRDNGRDKEFCRMREIDLILLEMHLLE